MVCCKKSIEGGEWKELGRVNSNLLHSYMYSDDITTLNGSVFYRIKEVAYDNTFKYSSAVSLRRTAVSYTKVSISPNPPAGNVIKITISSPATQSIVIRLLDVTGRIIHSSSLIGISNGNNVIELPPIPSVKGSIGFIEVLNAAQNKRIEVIKLVF
ncbi:hypothetical protein [Niastella populi]|uniref:Secretion system C-terminal sorting domain-containing protein n=1 Tax=Niastella populi TaxID=550983 RepID=A0A1V9F2C7_9BACT|nr:hypothetical protein [Niastella populi]OQP52509.1 hypothetical protein A4R26_28845 [Niastella populi]